MRFPAALAVALTFISAACSTTHVIPRPVDVRSFSTVAHAEGSHVDVIVPSDDSDVGGGVESAHAVIAPDGRPLTKARLVNVGGSGALVLEQNSPRLLDLADIHGYETTRHGEGAVEGLGIGLLAGAATGALAGFAAGDDPPCDQSEFLGCFMHLTAGDKAVFGGVMGALTGAVSGLVIGALVGHTHRYVFAPSEERVAEAP
jgi:hypothetical protein